MMTQKMNQRKNWSDNRLNNLIDYQLIEGKIDQEKDRLPDPFYKIEWTWKSEETFHRHTYYDNPDVCHEFSIVTNTNSNTNKKKKHLEFEFKEMYKKKNKK